MYYVYNVLDIAKIRVECNLLEIIIFFWTWLLPGNINLYISRF